MDKDQLDGLIALKLVGELRSFTAAARALRVSPPAISKMIKQLERRLGTTLFIRTTRTTRLTEAGQDFLNRAGPALDVILHAMQMVGSSSGKPTGRLRLNVPTMLYPNYLKPRLRSFIAKYPDVSVEVCFENAATDIFERGFDAGIRPSEILAKDLVALKLIGPLRYVVAAAPGYLDVAGRPSHPEDLRNHDCIVVGQDTRIYDTWEFEFEGQGFGVRVKPRLITNDSMVALDLALEGAGLIYNTEDAIADLIRSGRLEVVLNTFAANSGGYYLYYPQSSQVQLKLRAFIDHLRGCTKQKL